MSIKKRAFWGERKSGSRRGGLEPDSRAFSDIRQTEQCAPVLKAACDHRLLAEKWEEVASDLAGHSYFHSASGSLHRVFLGSEALKVGEKNVDLAVHGGDLCRNHRRCLYSNLAG